MRSGHDLIEVVDICQTTAARCLGALGNLPLATLRETEGGKLPADDGAHM